jgi:hypothetical protein
LVAVASAFTFVVSGCGGSGGSGGAQSKVEVVATANTICREFTQQSKSIGNGVDSAAEAIQAINQFLPVATRAIDQIAAMDPPSSERAPFDRFVDISRQQLRLYGDIQDAMTTGDVARMRSDQAQLDTLDVRSDIAAQQYGMTDCVSQDWKTVTP